MASGVRLTDCYQSLLNSRGSYTPQEPINSLSLGKALGGFWGYKTWVISKQKIKRSRDRKREKRANFLLFPRNSESYFSKIRVSMP